MTQIITSENPSRDVRRFLRHWADPEYALPKIRQRHPGLGRDRARTKARQAAVFLEQGLEHLESADMASVATKSLPLFYAAENLMKAACIVADEGSDARRFRAHGLSADQTTKRYSVKNLACRVGPPKGSVWEAVFTSFNGDRSMLNFVSDGTPLTYDSWNGYTTKKLAQDSELQVGKLVRHLPELADDVALCSWGHATVVHAASMRLQTASGPPETWGGTIVLRPGADAAVRAMVRSRESDLLKQYVRSRDEHDIISYQAPQEPRRLTVPVTRMDVFGEPWMDFARGTRVFGEIVLYFALLFILSSATRYQPDQWLRLLRDHPREAIVVDRLLDIGSRKIPNLLLSELQDELYLFRFAR